MAGRLNSGLLAELTRVKSGERLTKVVTAARMNAIQDAIRALIESQQELARDKGFVARKDYHPFQIIDLGMKQGTNDTRKVEVAWGTITPLSDSEDSVTITDLDTAIELKANHKVWIMARFDESGTITSCALKKGIPSANGWTAYPSRYEFTGSTVWNEWYHPIAEVRTAKTGKASTSGSDTGEYPVLGDDLVIAQLTNTHLVVQEMCNDSQKIFALVPGPGATTTQL